MLRFAQPFQKDLRFNSTRKALTIVFFRDPVSLLGTPQSTHGLRGSQNGAPFGAPFGSPGAREIQARDLVHSLTRRGGGSLRRKAQPHFGIGCVPCFDSTQKSGVSWTCTTLSMSNLMRNLMRCPFPSSAGWKGSKKHALLQLPTFESILDGFGGNPT